MSCENTLLLNLILVITGDEMFANKPLLSLHLGLNVFLPFLFIERETNDKNQTCKIVGYKFKVNPSCVVNIMQFLLSVPLVHCFQS